MPGSTPLFKAEIARYLRENYPRESRILDIGTGAGTFPIWLEDTFSLIDGIEIFEPYVEQFQLREFYHELFVCDAIRFDYAAKPYDIYLMGDVLEHWLIYQAQYVLRSIYQQAREIVVCVPFMSSQGAAYNNPHEIHLQNDLTPDLMRARYGTFLKPYLLDEHYGVYLKA